MLLIVAAALVIFGAGTGVGLVVDELLLQPTNTASASSVPSAFEEAWSLVHEKYVDTSAINDPKLINGAISGMLDALGDTGHTRYLSPDDLKAHQESLSGSFVGVGIQIQQENDQVVVVAPIADSPAFKAGVQANDILTKIDGQGIGGLTLSQVSDKVRGPEGSTVQLTFHRPSTNQDYTVALTRSKIKVNPVTWAMLPGQIGLIRLNEFSDGATKDLTQAIQDVQQAGATGIIFDLRDDPGGLVSEAMGVASAFLPQGAPVYISETRGGEKDVQRAEDSATRTTLPVVVLVNNGTASASEIVSGALKDDGRAEIVGVKTFGTGTVLNQFDLSNGGAVLLGTELWLTPDGKLIRDNGITPDVTVALPNGQTPFTPLPSGQTLTHIPDDDQLEAAVNVLKGEPVTADMSGSCHVCDR
ncbi:MAG TPA: S41 family peptidase [Thermomicrobiaceae bacterium]|nr:S41 family peptidase [Thermomicrobiaceae bacterium]